MKYREEISTTQHLKQDYVDGLDKLIISRQRDMEKARREYAKDIMLEPEKYRDDFKKCWDGRSLTITMTDSRRLKLKKSQEKTDIQYIG